MSNAQFIPHFDASSRAQFVASFFVAGGGVTETINVFNLVLGVQTPYVSESLILPHEGLNLGALSVTIAETLTVPQETLTITPQTVFVNEIIKPVAESLLLDVKATYAVETLAIPNETITVTGYDVEAQQGLVIGESDLTINPAIVYVAFAALVTHEILAVTGQDISTTVVDLIDIGVQDLSLTPQALQANENVLIDVALLRLVMGWLSIDGEGARGLGFQGQSTRMN